MGELGAAILTLKQQQGGRQQLQGHHLQRQQLSPVLQAVHIPAQPADAVNLSGAGDALVGGFAAALLRGCSPAHALAVGIAAAAVSVQCHRNVPGPGQGLTYARVAATAQQLLARQHTWEFEVPRGAASRL
jgi:bifunctional ADP-heptose synthase (sugar kinase/adenylyltransferase)